MTKAISYATGLPIQSRASTDAYATGWDLAFGNPKPLGEHDKPKDRVKLGVSPSTIVEFVDCRDGEMTLRDSDYE